MAPMAPALQPPKSRRCPGVAPMPLFSIRSVMTAATTRLPRNWKPKVASLAGASPLQKSLVQYLTKMRLALLHPELPSVAKMPPCSSESAHFSLLILRATRQRACVSTRKHRANMCQFLRYQ